MSTYTIKQNDTLSQIAKSYGVPLEKLLELNNIKDANKIYIGQSLKLPDAINTYTIKPGDSLSVISKLLGVPLLTLLDNNNLLMTSTIYPGQVLKYTYNKLKKSPVKTTSDPNSYVIKPGDSLSLIAKNNGISLSDLLKDNGLTLNSIIHPGQKLKLNNALTKPKGEWIPIEKILNYEQLVNDKFKNDPEGLINYFYSQKPTGKFYIIDDKVHDILKVYKDGTLVKLFRAIHGANGKLTVWTDALKALYKNADPSMSDDYTITFRKRNSKGLLIDKYGRVVDNWQLAAIDDAAGNLATPAGIFYTTKTGKYRNAPAFMRQDPTMIAEGNPDGIASSIHLRNNVGVGHYTNGCTGMTAKDLVALDELLKGNSLIPTYIMPYDTDLNKFFLRNGELNFYSSSGSRKFPSKNLISLAEVGAVQKKYVTPIKININNEDLKNPPAPEVYTDSWWDLNIHKWFDENIAAPAVKYTTGDQDALKKSVAGFISGLENNKELIMKVTGINDDTYNKLAKYALLIFGAESSYGKANDILENTGKGILKTSSRVLDFVEDAANAFKWGWGANVIHNIPRFETSPDIYVKADVADDDSNSIGHTLMRWSALTDNEKDQLKTLGVTDKMQFLEADKSAIATMIHLAQLYKDTNLNMDKVLSQWNSGVKYKDLAKKHEKDFTIMQHYKKGGQINYLKFY